MANGNDGASVFIDVGVDVGSSYNLFKKGLEELITHINKNPPKIRINLDLSQLKTSSIRAQVEKELNGKSSGGKVSFTINAEALAKTATETKNASKEILRLKTDISETTKQLIDLQNKIKEINGTNKSLSSQYFELKSSLGGEGAAEQNAADVERLKNKYLELMNAVELVRAKNATASAEEIQQIYVLQGEMSTLIAQIQEKIATQQQESAQQGEANSNEAEHTRLLKDAINLQNRYNNTIKNSTKAEYSASSSKYFQNLKEDLDYLNRLIDAYDHNALSAERFSEETKKLSLNLSQNFGAIKANGDAAKTFSERIGSLAEKFGYWFSITRVIMAVYRAIRQMVSVSIELDDAMTQLQIVTKDTEETYERFGEKIADTAKKIGSSISDLLDSTTVYAKLGYSLDESSMLAEYTAMLQNVGDIDVADAQDAITAIVKAFNVNVNDIESIMDKLVTTGNNFPISVAQIAEGMNNASSALAAAGNTFEQSVALLMAANVTIQNAAKSSTGLRTIAARIRNTKTELDELGEEMSEASYEELVQQLTDFNVALTTANGEYRSTYDIMYDIAQQWSKMTSMEQAAIATAMSGTRQQAVFYSIIEQFQEAMGAMDAMANSAGEFQKSYDIYMDSTTAHINQFKAAFQELGADTFDSDFLKQFIDWGTDIVEIFDGLMNIIEAIGGLNTLLYTTAGLIVTIKADAIFSKMTKIGSALTKLWRNMMSLSDGTLRLRFNINGLESSFYASAAGADAAAFSISAVQIAVGSLVAIIGAVIVGISLYNQRLQENIDTYKELADTYNTASETYEKNIDSLQKLKSEYEDLSKGVDYNGKNVSLTAEEYERYLNIVEQIVQISPNVCKGYDDEGNAIVNYKNVLNEAVSSQEQWLENQKRIYLSSGKDLFKGIQSTFKLSDNKSSDFTKTLSAFGVVAPPSTYGHASEFQIDKIEKQLDSARVKANEFRNVLDAVGVSFDDLYNNGSSAFSMDKLFAVTKLADHLDVFLNLLKEEGNYSEEMLLELESSILSADATAQQLIQTMQDGVDYLYAKLGDSNLYSEWFNAIPIDALNEFKNGLNYIIDPLGSYEENLMNAAQYGEEFSNAFKDNRVGQLISMSSALKSGEVSITEFNDAINRWKESFIGSDEVLNALLSFLTSLSNIANSEDATAVATEDWLSHYNDIPEIIENVDKWADVAAKASEEMAENGEISNDTIKALSELVDEGEDWLQYLTLENGELKLNIELLKERALQDSKKRIQNLEDELKVMQDQSDELLTQIALQQSLKQQDSANFESAQAAYDEMMANFPANPTQYDLGRKSALENYLNHYDTMISGYQFSYDKLADQIKEGLKQLEILRNTGRDFNKLLDEATNKSEDSAKTFNWIEAMLDRIQRKVNEFGRVVGSKFKSLSTRNEASKKEIEAITEEIALQEKAYKKYIDLCESIDISGVVSADEWKIITETIRNGAIDIDDYSEETAELISQYQEWYEAALDTKEAVDELHESLSSLYDDDFNRLQTDFENRISLLEYLSNMYNTGISQLETEGYMASAEFYKALTESTEHNIDLLKEELSGLKSALHTALDSGEIEMYSEAWYGYIVTMNGVKEAIAEANLSLAEFAKTMQEIDWEYFDYLQERITNITEESQFLLDLIGEDNIFEDGKLTDDGLSVLGLRAMDYNVYMAQADKYAQEIAEIEHQLANDPNNRDLLDRREKLLQLQRESILAAENEKDAILDLVQNAIEEELDSLRELIEAYKDALDAAKDLYDFRNKITDESSEISSLQKQLFAYSGDDSEEARATIQQLKDQLVKAQKELEETEYDKYINDQKKLLDNLYAEYELLLNQHMDNTDTLLADIIAMVNQNADTISDTLHMTADSVGYTLSDSMQTIWGTSFNSLQGVVAMYGDGFLSQMTTVNQALNNIASLVSNMQSYSNSWANSWIGGVNNSYVPDYSGWTPGGYGNTGGGYGDWDTEYVDDETYPTPNPAPAPTPTKPITVGGRINAAGATIYRRSDRSDGGMAQYFGSDPIYTVLSQQQNKYGETMLLVRHHSQNSGNTGWFRMSDVRAYKHGGLVDQTGLVWLDGTKQKPETVLNAEDTKRFQTFVESMDKFASKGFRMTDIGGTSRLVERMFDGRHAEITPIRNPNLSTTQDIRITIPIDHVYDYDDFINQLASDKNSRRIIQALAFDEVLGKNSLRVNRYKV